MLSLLPMVLRYTPEDRRLIRRYAEESAVRFGGDTPAKVLRRIRRGDLMMADIRRSLRRWGCLA